MGIPYGTDIYSLPVGADLPENDLTSYESLGELISRYNNEVLKQNFGRKIDPALVQIRDAIAHGRVSTTDTAKPLRLLKFDRPSRECRVRISFNQELTEVWFKEQKRRTNEAIHIVHASYVKLTGDL